MSYGGSSMISSFIVFALFQSLFIIQGEEDQEEMRYEEELEKEAAEEEDAEV